MIATGAPSVRSEPAHRHTRKPAPHARTYSAGMATTQRSGTSYRPGTAAPGPHWLLPVNPRAHHEHLPADWRERPDAEPVWAAIGRSQDVGRWCLHTGFRAMRAGDTIWAYLSVRQELCAVGTVRDVIGEDGAWFVLVTWDADRTAALCRTPIPRSDFGQVPMSTCRARDDAARVLAAHHRALAVPRPTGR